MTRPFQQGVRSPLTLGRIKVDSLDSVEALSYGINPIKQGNKPMTFPEFQQYLARYGFTYTPITSDQYTFLVDSGHDIDSCYGIACDVAAGYDFSDLI